MINRVAIGNHLLSRPLSRSGEAELLGPADRLDILDLLHAVGFCIDACAYEVLATIISEDFSFDYPQGIIEGRDEFIAFLKKENYFGGLRHQNANPVMRSVDLSNSVTVSYLTLTRVTSGKTDATGTIVPGATSARTAQPDGPQVVVHAVCTDLLKKEKEIWKLARRTLDQMSVSPDFVSSTAARELMFMTARERRAAGSAL